MFDANASLGRRHDRRVAVHTAADTLAAMDAGGVDRAVLYAPHAAGYDSREGNAMLLEEIGDESRLVPQFVFNPTWDELDEFAALVEKHDVRSVRMAPAAHRYPFRDWIVKPWLDWLGEAGIPVWLPVNYDILGVQYQINPSEVLRHAERAPGRDGGTLRGAVPHDVVGDAAAAQPAQPERRDIAALQHRRARPHGRRRRLRARHVRLAVPGRGAQAAAVLRASPPG